AIESNPMLELDEDGEGGPAESPPADDDLDDPIRMLEQLQASGSEEPGTDNQAMDLDTADSMPDDLPVDSVWDDIFESSHAAGQGAAAKTASSRTPAAAPTSR
ncbi:MAG: hypothetical protein Q7V62_00240, partial [Actinomycetota bacterium]|nr:hypothetical protein [Actinomycetota bacterium]